MLGLSGLCCYCILVETNFVARSYTGVSGTSVRGFCMKKLIALLSIPLVAALVVCSLAGVPHCMVKLMEFASHVL
jgi:hypothetical protein